jgi:hypothetical protein
MTGRPIVGDMGVTIALSTVNRSLFNLYQTKAETVQLTVNDTRNKLSLHFIQRKFNIVITLESITFNKRWVSISTQFNYF